jgi:glyoxylase-like metal-dependent hydrolase (beta-lactamase superfamily II)
MAATEVVPGLYMLALGPVNAFLLVASDGCTVIDTGLPRNAAKLMDALKAIKQTKVRRILLTHAHPDHIGSFAALKSITGAGAYMHRADATIAISGEGFRPMKAAPGLLHGLMFRLFVRPVASVEGAPVEHFLSDGEELPVAGGLKAIHVPGHCAGQMAFLWRQHGGVLIAADACSNIPSLGLSLGYEDLEEGRRSLRKLSALDFQAACFGHGKPILKDADLKFRRLWT